MGATTKGNIKTYGFWLLCACIGAVFVVACNSATDGDAQLTQPGSAASRAAEKADHDHDHDHDCDAEHTHDDDHDHDAEHDHGDEEHEHEHMEGDAGVLTLSATAQENLGIQFANVSLRSIEQQIRIPGSFTFLPDARQEYRSLLPGRVTLHVSIFDAVEAGAPLFSIDSMAWRTMQHEAVEAEGEVKMAEAALRVAEAQRSESRSTLNTIDDRIASLAAVNVRRAELEAQRVALRSGMPRHDAEIALAQAALEEAREHFNSRLGILSAATGLDIAALENSSEGVAVWRTMKALQVFAKRGGVVESIATNDGGWLENGELALTVADPQAVWFHGKAPQAELTRLQDGLRARIVAPRGAVGKGGQEMAGSLQLGLTGHAEDRTIDVYVRPEAVLPWARPGVSAHLEVSEAGAPEVPALPRSALVQDGLDTIFYKRDAAYPEILHRVVAELGIEERDWVEVRSGVQAGDEVVVAGAYALKVAGGASDVPEGFHVHADGTLHKEH